MKLKDGYYKVHTNNYVFILGIFKYGSTYSIKYGDPINPEGPCMELTYQEDKRTIKLDSLVHHARCSYVKDLDKGDGTREMIMSVLKFCMEQFPCIKRVEFNDVFAITCENRTLYLALFYICLHGQTWYEKYFQAKPANKEMKQALNGFRELLHEKPKQNVFSFFTRSQSKQNNSFHTWHEFFQAQNCMFFLDNYFEIEKVAQTKLLYSMWYISKRAISNYPVNILKITKYKPSTRVFHDHPQQDGNQHLSLEDL